MDAYDTSLYHPVYEGSSNAYGESSNAYKIVNQVNAREGRRNFEDNCNISQDIPQKSNSQNVVWGTQKLLKESCPNKMSINETPSHYAWNNFTKRISIVE